MFNRLYVHVPFCVKKCDYCAFVSNSPKNDELAEYPELLLRELQLHSKSSEPLDSIYFGGGTPSLLRPEQLAGFIDGVSTLLPISTDAEITLEANSGTIDSISMKKFREAGINRISLGVQSFDDRFLKLLGRIHTAEESRQAFFDIRKAGFENVSIDLMHSLPGQTLEQWRAELQLAIRLSPEHISVYGLTVEKETPFALRYPKGNRELADDDLSADMFESADELLTSAGFEHYEIANYARPGHKSLHNSGYWKRDGYLGLGVAAHSFLRDGYGVRFSNPENMDEYRRIVSLGRLLRVNEDHLTQDDAMSEYMFLGLRLAEGVALSAFELEFSRSIEDVFGSMPLDLDKFGLLRQNGERISLTLMGMLLSNQVFGRFML